MDITITLCNSVDFISTVKPAIQRPLGHVRPNCGFIMLLRDHLSEERIAACHLSFSRSISYSDCPIVGLKDSSNLSCSAVDMLALSCTKKSQGQHVRKSLSQLLPAVFLWIAPN